MANEFVARNGLIAQNNSVVSGSLKITGSLIETGSVSILGESVIRFAPTSSTGNVLTLINTNTSTNAFSTLALGSNYTNGPADIRLADTNTQGIRIYASNTQLTTSPDGAGFQFFNNATVAFPGQVYFDGGAHNNSAIIFRTAVTSGTITERMRITATGNVGIGTNSPNYILDVNGNSNFRNGLIITGSLTVSGSSITVKTPLIYDNGTNVVLGGPTSATTFGKIQISGSLGVGMGAGSYEIRPAEAGDGTFLKYIGTSFSIGAANSLAYGYTGGALGAIMSNADSSLLLDIGRYSGGKLGRVQVYNPTNSDVRLIVTSSDGYGFWASTESTGSVGIGVPVNAAPTYALDVSGSTNLRSELTVTGSVSNGLGNTTTGIYSHAEGSASLAQGNYSHAEGNSTIVYTSFGHAEGQYTIANGGGAHAEGYATIALGDGSHTEGIGTIASGSYQHVSGKYNKRGNTTSLLVVGNGSADADASRSDVLRVESTGLQITGSLSVTTGSVTISSSNIPPSPSTSNPFADDYNRVTLSPGGTPSLTYTNTNTGTGNTTIVSNYLNIVNGGTNGQSYTTVPLSGFDAPFNPTLASNSVTSSIEWTFNLRTSRNNILSGFGAAQYGAAVVLAGTSATLQNAGNGYALVYGGSGTRNWRLVRYTGGLSGTITDIISGGIFAANQNYVSVRIVYTPATNTWTYYFRDDGGVAWDDPTTTNTLIGSAVDSTYTSTLMSAFGVFFNYSTAANQNLQFDNLRVQQTLTPLLTAVESFSIQNYAGTQVFSVKDDGTTSISGSITAYPSAAGNGFSGSFSGSYVGDGTALVLGQSGVMITGSAALTVTSATTTLTLIPGLTTTITVPSQSMVFIQTNGGVNTTATTATGGSAIDVALVVDAAILTSGGYQRMYADNPTANATVTNWVANWNMGVILILSAGTHTVAVYTAYVAGSTATVSGGAGTIKQGTLCIMLLKNI